MFTISVATVSRVRRKATVARLENQRYRNHSGTSEPIAISAISGSRMIRMTMIAKIVSSAVSSPSRPASSSSFRVSTSDVRREMTRPDVNRSWNDTDRACMWSKVRRRTSKRMAWPMRPDSWTKTARSNPETSEQTANAMVIAINVDQ